MTGKVDKIRMTVERTGAATDHANKAIKLFGLFLITVIQLYCINFVSVFITSFHFVLQDLVSFSVKDGKNPLMND